MQCCNFTVLYDIVFKLFVFAGQLNLPNAGQLNLPNAKLYKNNIMVV